MREFPTKFNPINLSQFQQFKYERDICYLREAIYEHYLNEKLANNENKNDEYNPYETPFDLQKFIFARNPPRITEMVKAICVELEKLGWLTTVGHANSAIWIYPKSGPLPKSLPEW